MNPNRGTRWAAFVVGLVCMASRIHAQEVSASMTDQLLEDRDGDARADAGDTLLYTIVITNTGAVAADAVFSITLDSNVTVVPGSLSSTPLALPDFYEAFGNSDLIVDASEGLLANDFDPDGDPLSIIISDGVSAQGGTVNVDAVDGSFTYVPPLSFTGTDTFTYALDDGLGGAVSGRVTIDILKTVWFVDNSVPSNGNGTRASPFDNLADAETASASGDIVFLFHGDGTANNQDQGIRLKENQQFIGEGIDLGVGGRTIVPASASPRITHTSNAVVLANGNKVAGLIIDSVPGSGIVDNGFGAVGTVVQDVTILNASGAGISIEPSSNTTLASVTIRWTLSDAIRLNAAGTDISDVSITSASGNGILLANPSGSTSLSNVSIANASHSGILLLNASGGSITLADVSIEGASVGILVRDSTPALLANATSIGDCSVSGLSLQNCSGTFAFGDGLSIRDATGAGVDLQGFQGAFHSIGGTTIAGRCGMGIRVDAVTATIEFATTSFEDVTEIGIALESLFGSAVTFGDIVIGGTPTAGIVVGSAWGSSVDFGSCSVDKPQFFGYAIGSATDSTIAFQETESGPSVAGILVVKILDGSDLSFGETHLGPATSAGIAVGEASNSSLTFGETTIGRTNVGIQLGSVAGSGLQFGDVTIADATSKGITFSGDPVTGSLGGSVDFGSTLIGTRMGEGIEIEQYGGSILTFDRLDVTSEQGSGILASSSGTLNVAAGTIDASGGAALDIRFADLNLTFDSLRSTHNMGSGIELQQTSGAFTVTGEVGVHQADGTGIFIADSTGNVSIGSASITVPNGDGIQLSNNVNGSFEVLGSTFIDFPDTDGVQITGGDWDVAFGPVNLVRRNDIGIRIDTTSGNHTFGDTTVGTPIFVGAGRGVWGFNLSGDLTFSNLSVSDSPAQGIDLDNLSGSFSVSGNTTIDRSIGPAVKISNSPGDFKLGDLNVDNATTDGVGLWTFGGQGTLSIANGNLDTGSGVPVNIVGSGAGIGLDVTLESLSCDGALSGILLVNTSGSFSVKGDGTTLGSGAVILNAVFKAVALDNTENISLHFADIQDCGGHGIDGTGVRNFTLANSRILNAGDAVDEHGISFNDMNENNLSGMVAITHTRVSGMAHHGLNIENWSGELNGLAITDCTFENNLAAALGGSGARIRANGTSTLGSVEITDCVFTALDGAGVLADAGGSAGEIVCVISGNTFNEIGVNALALGPFGMGVGTYEVSDNPDISMVHNDDAIAVSINGASASLVIANNPNIDFIPAVLFGNNALFIRQDGDGDVDMTVKNNVIPNTEAEGIFATARDGNGSLDLTLTSNTIGAPSMVGASGVFVRSQDSNALCLNLSTSSGAGKNDSLGNTVEGYRLSQQDTSTFNLQDFGGGNAAAAAAFIEANNTGTATASGTFGTADCSTP